MRRAIIAAKSGGGGAKADSSGSAGGGTRGKNKKGKKRQLQLQQQQQDRQSQHAEINSEVAKTISRFARTLNDWAEDGTRKVHVSPSDLHVFADQAMAIAPEEPASLVAKARALHFEERVEKPRGGMACFDRMKLFGKALDLDGGTVVGFERTNRERILVARQKQRTETFIARTHGTGWHANEQRRALRVPRGDL